MAYVPNPADPTQPTDAVLAETAAAEFRALKAYIAGLAGLPGGMGFLSGMNNRFINGDFRIDQANSGVAIAVNSAVSTFGPDQIIGFGTAAAGVFTIQQLAATPPVGFKNYCQIKTTTADATPVAGSLYIIANRVEGLNLTDFNMGTADAIVFTTSMQIRSSIVGQFSGSFQNAAGNRSYLWTCDVVTANVWTPVQITLTADTIGVWASDNTIGLNFYIDIGSGATFRSTAVTWQAGNFFGVTGSQRLISTVNATLDITGLSLTPGSGVIPFVPRNYQQELALCQRYLPAFTVNSGANQAVGPGMCLSAVTGVLSYNFLVTPRIPPTGITFIAGVLSCLDATGAVVPLTGITFANAGFDICLMTITVAAGLVSGNATFVISSNANSKILFTGARL